MSRGFVAFCLGLLALGILATPPAVGAEATYPVGIRQIEFADTRYGDRILTMSVFYPAKVDAAAKTMVTPFFTGLNLYRDAALAPSG